MHYPVLRSLGTPRPVAFAFAVAVALLGLAGCDRRTTDQPLPRVGQATPVVSTAPDPSVPPASSVVSASSAPTAQDAPSGRVRGDLTKVQESSAMPMPGQVNNHSTTALDPVARGASAPK